MPIDICSKIFWQGEFNSFLSFWKRQKWSQKGETLKGDDREDNQ